MLRRSGWVCACVVVMLAAMPPEISAQDSTAAQLIERGLALREQGNDVAARPLIRQAYDLERTPRAAAQLGLVEQALGLWVAAEAHLTEALGSPTDAWISRNAPALQSSLATVRSHLGTLEVLSTPEGATVSIAGEVVGTTPLAAPLHVAAGRVDVEVALAGYRTHTATVEIQAGALARQLVELRPGSSDTSAYYSESIVWLQVTSAIVLGIAAIAAPIAVAAGGADGGDIAVTAIPFVGVWIRGAQVRQPAGDYALGLIEIAALTTFIIGSVLTERHARAPQSAFTVFPSVSTNGFSLVAAGSF